MHDVLDDRDLVPDEAEQRATSGYQVGSLVEEAMTTVPFGAAAARIIWA